jgi:hypothetical protein
MIPVAVTATPAPAPAQPGAPAEAPVSADFMALLLLMMGVGSEGPQAEGLATGERPGHGADEDLEPTATEPGPTVNATPGATLLVPVAALPTPAVLITPDEAAAPAPSAAPVLAATLADRTTVRLRSEGTLRPTTAPTSSPAGEGAPVTSAAAVTEAAGAGEAATAGTESTARLAELTAGHGIQTAPAAAEATPAREGAQARAAQPLLRELEPVPLEPTSARELTGADKAPAPMPATRVLAAEAGPAHGRERFEQGERQREGGREAGASPIGFAPLVDTAPLASLRPSQPTAEVQAPALIEPRAAVEQIVQAASVVVRGDEAEMHVQLDPPALGAVHVSATSRGTMLEVMISAERPETQALLTQTLPEIQHTLNERGLSATAVSVVTTPTTGDGRRAPDRRPTEPRDRSTSHPHDRRRTAAASRRVSALDITV